jgi:hypothetical protein
LEALVGLVREDLKKEVANVADVFGFVDELVKQGRSGSRLYFRGQTDGCWGLEPTIARKFAFGGESINGFSRDQEIALLHRFRRRAYGLHGGILSKWEAMFLARHHGLPVRLLDWTMNPLVALYFACTFAKAPKCDGAVWVLAPKPNLKHIDVLDPMKKDQDPLKVKGIKIIYPHDVSPRITLQSGLFTIQDYPVIGDLSASGLVVPKVHNEVDYLTKWTVPAGAKGSLLRTLDRAAINKRTLGADFDAIAQGLWESELLRHNEVADPDFASATQ